MAIAAYASGTQTCVPTTEHFVSSPNVAGEFQLGLEFVNLAASDRLVVGVYKMLLTGGTSRLIAQAAFSGDQSYEFLIWMTNLWVPNDLTDSNAVRYSLTLTNPTTTNRDVPYKVYIRNAEADVTKILGTAVSSPATGGILDVNVKNINNVAATSVTAVGANIGTSQPLNFTGTAGSAYVRTDMLALSGDSTAADNAESFFDGTGYAGTNNVIPLVTTTTTLTNAPSDSAGVATLLTRVGTPSNLGGGATVAANLADIESQTDDIGVAGAGLTAIAGGSIDMADFFTEDSLETYASAVAGSVVKETIDGVGALLTAAGIAVDDIVEGVLTAALASYVVPGNVADALNKGGLVNPSGTAQAGAAATITLASAASTVDDYYNDAVVRINSGTGSGQRRRISDYVGTTRVASVEPSWATTPDNTSVYEVLPAARVDVGAWLGTTPLALASQRVVTDVGAISGDATAADNLESYTDGTTPMPVNVFQISGDATAADNLESYTDGTTPMPVNILQISGDATAADNLEAYTDGTTRIPANMTAIGGNTSVIAPQVAALGGQKEGAVIAGTLTSTSFSTNLTDTVANTWRRGTIEFRSGTLINQRRVITTYVVLNGVITVDEAFSTAPSASDQFVII